MPSLPYPVLCPIALFEEDELKMDSCFNHVLYGIIDLDGVPDETARNFTFSITFKNDRIAKLIQEKKAKMSLILEAKTSLVRKAIELNPTIADFEKGVFSHHPVSLDALGVALPAEATIYIASIDEILGYDLPGAPASMGRNDGVNLPRGAILGYSMVLPLLPRLEKASSIIEIKLKEDLLSADSPLIQYTETDKILVFLDARSYAVFSHLKDNASSGPAITYALVMPALIQAVSVVMQAGKGDDFDEAISSRLWYRSLDAAIQGLKDKGANISDQSLPYEVAHLIMKGNLGLSDALIKIPESALTDIE
jgi:hypothetical protein